MDELFAYYNHSHWNYYDDDQYCIVFAKKIFGDIVYHYVKIVPEIREGAMDDFDARILCNIDHHYVFLVLATINQDGYVALFNAVTLERIWL